MAIVVSLPLKWPDSGLNGLKMALKWGMKNFLSKGW